MNGSNTIEALYEIYKQHSGIQTDTRKLKAGDVYFALKGPNFDGNAFVQQALDAGAAYAVTDDAAYTGKDKCFVVNDVLTALQHLAKHHRRQFSIPFIAITGSNGKTTTKELVTAVLQTSFTTYATEGNLNNHIGVPLTLLKIKNDAEMAVIEMGANHQKEIAGYCVIALPTHGIITNCGKAHIEGFGGEEGVRKGKGELYDFLRDNNGTIFRNTDLPYLEDMAKGIGKQITYGSANAEYIGKPLNSEILLSIALMSKGTETTIPTQLVGVYNFANVMTAVAVGLHFGIGVDKIKQAISNYAPDNSRSQWLNRAGNKIILDAYNANPTSMRAAIINFAEAKLDGKMLWLGGMKEMGTEEQHEHEELVALVDKYNWEEVLLVGKEFNGLQGNHKWFENSQQAAEYIHAHNPNGKSILIKGSRGSKMELLLQAMPEN